ncbi:hypothetical protein ACIQAC_01450 [Streptomyces sp. NPDC088387]|uniref:hypothetical protein n=1 Tax=Streptomyces sp. NPDC088387 TaxID=3365859 RepID=UPI0038030D36
MSTTPELFPGELEMLRGLVRLLRTVVRENDTLPEVRRLLWEHVSDESAAHAARETSAPTPRDLVEKSSRPAAVATPEPTGRVAHLLDTIRSLGGTWTVNKAVEVYRQMPAHAGMKIGRIRHYARGDLRDLAAWGLITAIEINHTHYVADAQKGGTA